MLESAKNARLLNRIILTTDSDTIAQIANQVGGIEVHRHDPALSVSGQPSFGVFRHTLEKLMRESGTVPQAVALLRVTTPLCLSSDIESAITLLCTNKNIATAVLSVVKSDIHPKRVYMIDTNGLLHTREDTPERNYPLPRQIFDEVYVRNGAIYATFPEIVLEGSLWGNRPLAYVMPKERSININDETDFILAEALLMRR